MVKDVSNVAHASEDVLKALDAIVIVDHSGSMAEPSTRHSGKNRLDEVKEDCIAVARTMEKYDDDGIALIAFSGNVRSWNGVKADNVVNLFKEVSPKGSTNLHGALAEAVKLVDGSKKNAVVFVYTDGAPDDAAAAKKVIEDAGKKLGRPKIGFVFCQVGNDAGATKFLEDLDNNLSVDVVATLSAQQAENLDVAQLVTLAQTA